MGWPMAACLVRAGYSAHVNDARREVANNFVQQIGGSAPDSLGQLAGASNVVVTMLPTSAIVCARSWSWRRRPCSVRTPITQRLQGSANALPERSSGQADPPEIPSA